MNRAFSIAGSHSSAIRDSGFGSTASERSQCREDPCGFEQAPFELFSIERKCGRDLEENERQMRNTLAHLNCRL